MADGRHPEFSNSSCSITVEAITMKFSLVRHNATPNITGNSNYARLKIQL